MDGTYFEIAYWHTSVTWGSMPKYTIRHRVEYGMVACWLGLCIWDIHSEWRWHSAGWAWFGLCRWELCFSDAFIGRPCFWLCCWHHWRFQRRERLNQEMVRVSETVELYLSFFQLGSGWFFRVVASTSKCLLNDASQTSKLSFCIFVAVSSYHASLEALVGVFGVPFSFCDRLEADYSAAGRRNCYHV